ncbi:hypothetical protein [Nitrosomonas communis]|uniref:hypothetical protein n=1 Tax=Nitrosomonas communis TaxID=44574 RepID=UPI003D2892DC
MPLHTIFTPRHKTGFIPEKLTGKSNLFPKLIRLLLRKGKVENICGSDYGNGHQILATNQDTNNKKPPLSGG